MKEFHETTSYLDLPDNLWFEVDDLLNDWDSDLFSELNIEMCLSLDDKNNLTIHEITPVLSSFKESEMIKEESKTVIKLEESAKLAKVAQILDVKNSFNLINTSIMSLPKNKYSLLSGVTIGKLMGTRVSIDGQYYQAKNLFAATLAHKGDYTLNKIGTIVTETILNNDGFNLVCLKFIHENFAPNIEFDRWVTIISNLDLTQADQYQFLQELITSRYLSATTIEALYSKYTSKPVGVVMASSPGRTAFNKMKEIAIKGGQRGVIGTINQRFVREITSRFGDSLPAFFHGTAGQKSLEGLLPALVMVAIEFDINNKMPYKDQIRKIAENALEHWAGDGAALLTEGIMDLAGPYLEEYRAAAASLELTETPEAEEDFEGVESFSGASRRELAHAHAGEAQSSGRGKTI